jgi:putative phosphoesterase
MKIAVLADIHGNVAALDAVLADLGHRKPDLVVDLGDRVSGPLWPRETMERLEGLNAWAVRGNHDRQVSTLSPGAMGASDRYAFAELRSDQRKRLEELPLVLAPAPGVMACHATPRRDDLYLLDEIADGRLVRSRTTAIEERLGPVDARVVLCGHSHRPDLVRLPNGVSIINPGSVGCPAYDDPSAPAHVSESGSPHARYAMLDLTEGEMAIEFIALPYGYEEAAKRAGANGRPEWAYALRTGIMPPT